MSIQKRKKEHVELSVGQNVDYQKKTGFEEFDFIHDALPEINLSEVDLRSTLLDREFAFPLFISSMTGGYSEAGAVNTVIAEFCESENLPFGVGSQRAMLENRSEEESFSVVRKYAPSAFIAANIGGAQLIGGLCDNKTKIIIESIEADAVIVHLNPLQELIQPEGDRKFKGIEEGIADLVRKADCPVIVKETGAGISASVAERLLNIGVSVIDVSGAGGTSWSRIENLRKNQENPIHEFDDWGIPTVECIRQVNSLRETYEFEMIASGGIRSSFDILKAVALGADFTAAAQPIIKSIIKGGSEALADLYKGWRQQAAYILTLVGCERLQDLDHKILYKKM